MSELVVWKATLAPGTQFLALPRGSELLCVHEQNNEPCLWYRCDPNHVRETRHINVVVTGMGDADGHYLGTAMLDKGRFVVHVFELSSI